MSPNNSTAKAGHHRAKSSSVTRSYPSFKPRKQSSSLQRNPSSSQASPSKLSTHKDTLQPHQICETQSFSNQHTQTYIDLLGVSAWVQQEHIPEDHQVFFEQSHNTTQSTACPYHVSILGMHDGAAASGCGLAPVARWLAEDVEDEGAFFPRSYQQSQRECTCIKMAQDNTDLEEKRS
ncbi:hypothetical protein DL95DRAFT_413229 [Leptodontidium sp. 2 PMI_412]|nr:hypothetical protein DL95DRAFT_413229 [Leptodontidium sp. 2 PMI_412]